MSNNRISRVAVTSTPGSGRHVILETANTSVNTGPPVIRGVTALQSLGQYSGTVDVDIPANGANKTQDVSFVSALSPGIPNAFTIESGSTGQIRASCATIQLPDDGNLVLSQPALSLTFGTGAPNIPGSGTWNLYPSIQYQGPTLNISVRCYSASATKATTVTFIVEASLLGFPLPA